MALLILALLQRIFLMSSLMLLLVWLIFFMVLIKLLPILGTISGKTVKLRKPPLPALTVKLSKYNVDDVALGVCKTGAEEAGVTEVRTSLSEKKFELWREIKV